MPGIERNGEKLPRLSPGVGCDSTAQGEVMVPLTPLAMPMAIESKCMSLPQIQKESWSF